MKFSVQFSHSVMSNSVRPHGLQHARLPCLSLTPGATQTHVHLVSDAIQPSYPLSSPSPPAFNHYQHQGLFKWVSCKEHNQYNFIIDHLEMSMCRVISWVSGKGCLLLPMCSLDKTLLAFALLHFVLQGQTCLLFSYLLTSYFCIPTPFDEKGIFFGC